MKIKIYEKFFAIILSMALTVSISTFNVQAQITDSKTKSASLKTATEDGFVIENGVLIKYTGTATHVAIPSGVTEIKGQAFANCKQIISVVIPDGVKNLGSEQIAGSASSVQYGAFYGCSNLANITIPQSVISIGGYTFHETKWLDNKRNENTLVIVNNILVDGQTAKGAVKIPDNVTYIADQAFQESSITAVRIPRDVKTIGKFAFNYCKQLETVSILNGIESIGCYAFEGCRNLLKAQIPSSVKSYIKYDGEIIQAYDVEWIMLYPKEVYIESDSSMRSWYENSYPERVHIIEDSSIDNLLSDDSFDDQKGVEPYIVTLTEENTSVSKSDMTNLVELNKTQPIIIKSNDGVSFTFPTGCMDLVERKEDYNFGVKLITDYSLAQQNEELSPETFVFQINYNYDGALPGTAKVSIPVDSKWINARLYYYRISDNGELAYLQSAVVDTEGYYTISLSHCSKYVLMTKNNNVNEPIATERPTETPVVTNKPIDNQTKIQQVIVGKTTYKKVYGDKAFSLDAKLTKGDGTLSYNSSDQKVSIVDNKGKVTLKGTGVAVITVTAADTQKYNTTSMKVTVKVTPKKGKISNVKVAKGKKIKVKWKRDNKTTGYQIQVSTDTKFKKGVKSSTIKKTKATSAAISKLKKGKKYYVKIRMYKTVGESKLYGAWSEAVKSSKVK